MSRIPLHNLQIHFTALKLKMLKKWFAGRERWFNKCERNFKAGEFRIEHKANFILPSRAYIKEHVNSILETVS